MEFLGPFLLGVGPLIVIFCLFIARKSFVVLLSLASAFYWLTILLALASLFAGVVPLPRREGPHAVAVLVGVLVEQVAKYGLYRIYVNLRSLLGEAGRRTGHGFTSIDALWLSFGLGFGHAATHATFFFVSLLETTSTDATIYDFDRCPQMSFYVVSALITLGFSMFHTFSTIVFFDGLSGKNTVQSIAPPLTHLIAALLTLANFRKDGCLATVPLLLLIGIMSVIWAASITWKEVKCQFPTRIHQSAED